MLGLDPMRTPRAPDPLRAGLIVVAAVAVVLATGGPAAAAADWNDAAVDWKDYEQGLAEARKSDKPVCLVFYTDWCPHCARYSGVFHHPEVVETSKKFVMIRVERDGNRDISKQYAPDGEYIPRTYFLTSGGRLRPEIHEQRPSYLYFYDTTDPQAVLRGMRAALDQDEAE